MFSFFFPDLDSADTAQLVRIATWFSGPCFALLSLLWFLLKEQGVIPPWLFVVLLAVNVPLTWAGVVMIYRTTSRSAEVFVKSLLAAGDIAPPKSYPRQDVLIARGEYQEAADYFRDHIRVEPEDHEARLRLADLLERHLKEHAGAERLLLEVRRENPAPREELLAANGLIDLYRKTGRRDRLMVELARFVDRYRGSRHAEAAVRELKELKAERS